MVRISYGMAAKYPAGEAVELIRTADELGFHGCYVEDDPSSRDPWLLCAAAARETRTIRLGLSSTHAYLRDPTLIAQALATLDELSDGRAESAVSYGDPFILDAYHVDWRGRRPLARLREAILVMRAYLDTGEVTYAGESFSYSGLAASARPVQARLPLLIGAMGGPRSFELAGEVADGVHCISSSRASSAYVVEHVRRGAQKEGRDWRGLDIAAGCITAVAPDPAVAKEAARAIVAAWLPSLPRQLMERHGLDHDEVRPAAEAAAAGDIEEALRLTTPAISEALSIAGTPEECRERIQADIVDGGIDHIILAIADPIVVAGYTGRRPDGPDSSTPGSFPRSPREAARGPMDRDLR